MISSSSGFANTSSFNRPVAVSCRRPLHGAAGISVDPPRSPSGAGSPFRHSGKQTLQNYYTVLIRRQ